MTRFPLLHQVFAGMRCCVFPAVALVVGASQPARSGDEVPLWRGQVALSTVYDNNALRYSDKYLGRFENGEDEGRFHIETTDDVFLHSALHLERLLSPLDELPTVLSGDLHLWGYVNNTVKNWWSFSLSGRQDLPARFTASFLYSHIPSFYVRHYSDDDWAVRVGPVPERFQPFSFAKDEYRFTVQHQLLQSTRIRLLYSTLRYYYNEHYTEYDSHNASWAVDVAHTLVPALRINAGYAYGLCDTKGVDEPGEVRETADDADGSYREDSYTAMIIWRLPRFAGLTSRLTLDGEYSQRCFTTTHLYYLDDQHAGRVDHEYQASLDWTVRFSEDWEATAGYAWRQRMARTSIPEIQNKLSDEKDYREFQVEIGLTYDFSF